MKTLIVIPARLGSTRFPDKPLAMINGRSMLSWVTGLAEKARELYLSDHASTDDAKSKKLVDIVVSTEHERVMQHATDIGVRAVITSEACVTGSDRAWATCQALNQSYDAVINLQGDAPLTPPHFITEVIRLLNSPDVQVATPAIKLTWEELDSLRQNKTTTPFSGTTVIINKSGRALWFSKNIIPALRSETQLRSTSPLSPVLRHVGIYGFRPAVLEKFAGLPQGTYETHEGLEQLRLLENDIPIHVAIVDHRGQPCFTGVDSPEDIGRVEALLKG
jgi:3-deoxy-manno-octulosonate cytidylyltransferase (CMP-KDO synthetase)